MRSGGGKGGGGLRLGPGQTPTWKAPGGGASWGHLNSREGGIGPRVPPTLLLNHQGPPTAAKASTFASPLLFFPTLQSWATVKLNDWVLVPTPIWLLLPDPYPHYCPPICPPPSFSPSSLPSSHWDHPGSIRPRYLFLLQEDDPVSNKVKSGGGGGVPFSSECSLVHSFSFSHHNPGPLRAVGKFFLPSTSSVPLDLSPFLLSAVSTNSPASPFSQYAHAQRLLGPFSCPSSPPHLPAGPLPNPTHRCLLGYGVQLWPQDSTQLHAQREDGGAQQPIRSFPNVSPLPSQVGLACVRSLQLDSTSLQPPAAPHRPPLPLQAACSAVLQPPYFNPDPIPPIFSLSFPSSVALKHGRQRRVRLKLML